MADLIQGARAGAPAPVYVLCSSSPLLLERALRQLRDAALPAAARAFNYDVIDGKGASAKHVVALAQTVPMLAGRRMVVVRDIAAMAAAELSGVIAYLKAPNPSSVFVALAFKVDKRLKFFQVAAKLGQLHELELPRDLVAWIRQEAAAQGVAVQPGACRRLADVVGRDLSRLALAIEQLSLYAGPRAIEADDVDELIADTRERSIFELTEALGAGDLPRALAAVVALCDQRQSAVGVVAMVARYVRQIALTRTGLAQGCSRAELARLAAVPPFVVDKLVAQARRFPVVELAAAFSLLHHADAALKGLPPGATKTLGRDLGERIVLERLVSGLLGN